jgi:serine phosphatase RsbU (regulator of sigma subunit)
MQAVEETIAAEKTRHDLAAIEHDLSIARDIQMSLMPSAPPVIANFDIAGMARPAQQAGGDYYDWQQMPDGRLVVALADVTGHGIGPAIVMAVCRAYARATAPSMSDPEAMLRRINHLIFEDLRGSGRFITMAIAILSPDGTVELISAGHGPTLFYNAAKNDISSFGGDGIPLGLDSAERYSPYNRLKMNAGDVLLLLTDGFIEWQRNTDAEQFGTNRLCQTLRGCASMPAKSILSTIDAAVNRFAAGSPQLDDTTAVVIRRI